MSSSALLFVANLPTVANAQYVERLFSAYGHVADVKIVFEGSVQFAEVMYNAVDDADSAIAALHHHYCASRNTPLVVLYHVRSPCISEYGRKVGREYAQAAALGRDPSYIPLEGFDENYPRTDVPPPPSDREIFEGARWNDSSGPAGEGRLHSY
ncbi:RNA-binding protein, putative [Trypanosoma equiperdum]|uniref:RNA-binding protein, putative n=2 Tax=Trypanozoon TaxID=39700 RepID=Q587B9_TRYB2|nr:RNA-binding protein, putative [Trypanosoma brucei brucei TREU927]AAX79258.1 RNA-binding protein, putative [Trypanosoma brucei]AAZ12011.1 RNA-binding protein, putative [Trypanosoma brucei brucei TREU927]SCU64264.1 RNA-binding protein, putative [Trypanosoma equiperdum]